MKRLFLAVPLMALAVACGSSSAQPSPATLPSLPLTTAPPAPQDGPVGTTFSDGSLAVTVDSVKLTPQLTAPGGLPDPERSTNGQWAVIHVTESNPGPAPVEAGQLYVKTDDGTTWNRFALGDVYGQELPAVSGTTVAAGDKSAGLVLVDMGKQPGNVIYENAQHVVLFRWRIG